MFMQNLDTNKDGKVSKEEYLKPGEEQFRQIDKNGDGAITRDEADAYHKEMQQRMEQMRQQTQQQRQGGEEPGAPAGQYPQR
jgi:Ca2+-binding EF-hand superfamily protein